MEISKLKKFIWETTRNTFASGDAKIRQLEKDESTTITYKKGDWKLHDNYFGGEPYAGRLVIFYKNRPVWINVYYGWVDHSVKNFNEVYGFLENALRKSPKNMPIRGLKSMRKGEYRYSFSIDGDVKRFSAIEKIFKNKNCIYEAYFRGGLVDVKR